jgi:hypothetical protein
VAYAIHYAIRRLPLARSKLKYECGSKPSYTADPAVDIVGWNLLRLPLLFQSGQSALRGARFNHSFRSFVSAVFAFSSSSLAKYAAIIGLEEVPNFSREFAYRPNVPTFDRLLTWAVNIDFFYERAFAIAATRDRGAVGPSPWITSNRLQNALFRCDSSEASQGGRYRLFVLGYSRYSRSFRNSAKVTGKSGFTILNLKKPVSRPCNPKSCSREENERGKSLNGTDAWEASVPCD